MASRENQAASFGVRSGSDTAKKLGARLEIIFCASDISFCRVIAKPSFEHHITFMRSSDEIKPATDTGKLRPCLKCQATFRSEWAGNRICERCKHMSSWREGVHAYAPSPGRHR